MKIGRSALYIACSQIFVGALSYGTVFVGARVLSVEDLARFSTVWAIVNTIILTTLIPIETYGPKLFIDMKEHDHRNEVVSHSVVLYCLLSSVVAMSIFVMLNLLGLVSVSWEEEVAAGVFVLGAALYASKRTFATATSNFRSTLLHSILYATTGLLGLAVILSTRTESMGLLFVVVGISAAVVYFLPLKDFQKLGFSRQKISEVVTLAKETRSMGVLRNLSIATFLSLILSNGAVSIGLKIGVTARELVLYSALLNMVLIPMTLLNAFTPPIMNIALELFATDQMVKLRQLYVRTGLFYVLVIAITSIVVTVSGAELLRIYLGAGFTLTKSNMILISISEGIATLIVLPRVFMVVIGQSKNILIIWVFGLFVFALTMFIPISSFMRIVLAPGISGLSIMLVSSLVFYTTTRTEVN